MSIRNLGLASIGGKSTAWKTTEPESQLELQEQTQGTPVQQLQKQIQDRVKSSISAALLEVEITLGPILDSPTVPPHHFSPLYPPENRWNAEKRCQGDCG